MEEKSFGFIVNNNKTEDATTTRGARNLTDLNVHNYYAFERVPEFKYVSRTIINDRNNTHERIPRSVNRFSFFFFELINIPISLSKTKGTAINGPYSTSIDIRVFGLDNNDNKR